MTIDLAALAGWNHSDALRLRLPLFFELLREAKPDLRERTSCLTLLAGAGTRWIKSLPKEYPVDAPRGLFPVKNYLGGSRSLIPMAAYAIEAFRGLGRQTIVVRGWEEEICGEILAPLGIDRKSLRFRTQAEGPSGKVLGHGDAARQAYDDWKESDYVIVNFGGDANSPLSAFLGLLALSKLEELGEGVDLLLPVASIQNPAYPIQLDSEGIPRAFGHNKLGGKAGWSGVGLDHSGKAYTNVGIRVYRTKALARAIGEIVGEWWSEESGYSIPGNDPEAREFALDNVDAMMARAGRARILASALPEELTPAKSFDEVGRFEEAVRLVRQDWNRVAEVLESEYPANPWSKQKLEGSGS
jgi:hypothetical protein